MKKAILLLTILFVLLASSIPVLAANEPVIYKDTITMTEDGGRYQVGFTEIEFKKEYMDSSNLPITFEVQIYAENGETYIEFKPDIPKFIKKVHIRADKYNGVLFDKAAGKNIEVNIKNQQILAEHFSRYMFH